MAISIELLHSQRGVPPSVGWGTICFSTVHIEHWGVAQWWHICLACPRPWIWSLPLKKNKLKNYTCAHVCKLNMIGWTVAEKGWIKFSRGNYLYCSYRSPSLTLNSCILDTKETISRFHLWSHLYFRRALGWAVVAVLLFLLLLFCGTADWTQGLLHAV